MSGWGLLRIIWVWSLLGVLAYLHYAPAVWSWVVAWVR